ncbi:hypothetical protein TNCV_748231 [Trichonephila clavipes]|nr:hypothetical protein TNCV_748231 [Trichonephila clavipes]
MSQKSGMIKHECRDIHIMPEHLNGVKYLVFLQQVLRELRQEVPNNVQQKVGLMRDGAPTHFSFALPNYQHTTYLRKWIG